MLNDVLSGRICILRILSRIFEDLELIILKAGFSPGNEAVMSSPIYVDASQNFL